VYCEIYADFIHNDSIPENRRELNMFEIIYIDAEEIRVFTAEVDTPYRTFSSVDSIKI
jgi:hypothetical protein